MHAINFEKDTLLYFHALYAGVGDDRTRNAVRHIIDEEVSHVLQLNNYKAGLK
jgi:rubrerythrin